MTARRELGSRDREGAVDRSLAVAAPNNGPSFFHHLTWLWRGPALAVSGVMIFLVRGYQWLIRPLLPPACRFQPGCSEYFILAVRKYGPVIGAAKGTWRICRCNPWCEGGYDPP